MPETAPPPLPPAPHGAGAPADEPIAPEGAGSGRGFTNAGYGVDPDGGGVRYPALRVGGLLAALVALGLWNPWMLVMVLAVVVMIFLHELGHFVMAKRAGMKVTEFFLFFGPKLWSFRRGETEYGIKLIPAGAYVKIPGMVNLDEVAPEDEARTYRQKSFPQRIGVAVAGSAMHFMLAFVLIFVALVIVGQPHGTLAQADDARPTVIDNVLPGSGAAAAGLQGGDRIAKVAGTPTPDSDALASAVAPNRGDTVPVVVVRDGAKLTVPVELKAYTYHDDVDGTVRRKCGLGIEMAPAPNERLSPAEGLVQTPKEFGQILWLSAQGLGRFFSPSGIKDFAGQVGSAHEDRASQQKADQADKQTSSDPCASKKVAPTSAGGTSASGGSSSGQNRILSIYGLVRLGSDVGGVDPAALLGLFALINIFIGMFNLIPLLPFDGGHVAIACYERVQEKRLHRRRYFADVTRLLPITYGVVLLLGMLFVSSLYLDVVNPIGG